MKKYFALLLLMSMATSGSLRATRTASGITYTIEKFAPLNARSPRPGETVRVHYTGWLDVKGQPGKKFDSSVDRGQPFVFKVGVGQVIAGWDESVLSMKVGEKRRVIIPSHLGYGTRGAGNSIPPNASLIFVIELIAIQ